jgi:hypothetical protein
MSTARQAQETAVTHKIEPLVFQPDSKTPGFEIRKRTMLLGRAQFPPYSIMLWHDGFEAERYTSLDELEVIRDWLNDLIEGAQG